MVEFGAHAFVWIGDWQTDSGNHAIKSAGEAGFDFIEIPLLKPDTFDVQSHKQVIQDTNIEATCSLVLPRDAHMPAEPERAFDFLMSVLDVMHAIGSRYLSGCIAYSLGTLTGKPPTTEERETVIDVLKRLGTRSRKTRHHLGHWRRVIATRLIFTTR